MPRLIETLAAYVPREVAHRVANSPAPITRPYGERFPAAILFVDISGFTPLAEHLTQRGQDGVEELSRLLNAHFGDLIEIIAIHGGDVVKFAGDALLAMWPAKDEPLATATRRASQCGLSVVKHLNDYAVIDEVRLYVKASIGAGNVLAAHVGGAHDHWKFLVAGEPLVQISSTEKLAGAGDVVLSSEARTLVSDYCLGDPLPGGKLRLAALGEELSLGPSTSLEIDPDAENGLRVYIPETVLISHDAGLIDWLAELRRVTVLFINVNGLDFASSGVLHRLQSLTLALQNKVFQYGGSITEIGVDDKGTTAEELLSFLLWKWKRW